MWKGTVFSLLIGVHTGAHTIEIYLKCPHMLEIDLPLHPAFQILGILK